MPRLLHDTASEAETSWNREEDRVYNELTKK